MQRRTDDRTMDRSDPLATTRALTAPRTASRHAPLYTPAERARRDRSRWTIVQGVLAPLQLLIFAVSLVLVVHALLTGHGYGVATTSVVVKTLALYAIMVTGAAWEKDVYGQWLFADAFFWEDVVSMLVLALHTAYLAALGFGLLAPRALLALALAAYASYVVNATQFIVKFRRARRDAGSATASPRAGAAELAAVGVLS